MKGEPLLFTDRHVVFIRRAMMGALILVASVMAISGLRMWQARAQLADLSGRVKLQRSTLAQMRQTAVKPASTHTVNSHSDAVAKVQERIEESVHATGCILTEFQASPDRQPYLSLFTLDTNKPDWEQISVHVTLTGRTSQAMATIEDLRKADTPIEPDSLEIVREPDLDKGVVKVTLRVVFRILVPAGGAA